MNDTICTIIAITAFALPLGFLLADALGFIPDDWF